MTDPVWQAIVLLLVLYAVVQTIVLIGVMRQLGGVLLQLRPAHIGELPGEGPEMGIEVNVPGLNHGRPGLVIFLAPGCGLCKPLLPAIEALHRSYRQDIDVVAAVIGAEGAQIQAYANEVGVIARADLAHLESDWKIPGTPFVVAIDRESRTYASGAVNSLDQLDTLADEVVRHIKRGEDVLDDPDSLPAASTANGDLNAPARVS